MDDLISRQDVLDIIMGDGLYCDTYDDKEYSAERIKSIPTADLSEYCDKLWKIAYERGQKEARPKGKWKVYFHERCGDGFVWSYQCSQCGHHGDHTAFCPHCGARMEESDG